MLAEFFQLVDGAWANGRASREVVKAQTKIEAARTNGAKGGRPKGKANGTEREPTGLLPGSVLETQAKAHQTPDTTSLSPSGKKEKPPRKRGAAPQLVSVDSMVAEGVDPQNAADWLVSRKAKDLPLTPTAWQQTKDEAVKAGLTTAEAIKTAAGNGWAGFKASWLDADTKAPRATTRSSRHSGFATKDYREGVTEDGQIA